MSEVKHIPGPYKYDPDNDREDLQIRDARASLIASVEDNRIYTLKQCQATAKLFAAAPDMYEAIQCALNIKDLWIAQQHGTVSADHEGEMQALKAMQDKLEAALMKATQ